MPGRTLFSTEGLNLGKNNRSLVYYYGLSDFWQFIFEDTDKIDLLLEASSQKFSDIYSKFLQLVSTISIKDIEVATHQQLKLVLIKDSDLVAGKVNTFKLPEIIVKSRLIVNRPFLPTSYLEENIHYKISDDGTEIQFYEPLSSVGFATRINSDDEKEYAAWFVDSIVDENFLFQYYGNLIDVKEDVSTESYKNFLYGLYYLYTNGPDLALVRKGLNLVLGIPLAREEEVVLDSRKDDETGTYFVLTDLNSYQIPYGFTPTVAIGDVLEATQELAEWIEVKDYVKDDDWWINISIPPTIMPYIPTGETSRIATTGSYADYLMDNFLKYHTFLINVKANTIGQFKSFEDILSIVRKIKPSYTEAIYVWTLPGFDDSFSIEDTDLSKQLSMFKCEDLSTPIYQFKRDDINTTITRECPMFTRITVSQWTANQLGFNDEINDGSKTLDGSYQVDGVVNVISQFRPNTANEIGWLRAILDGDQDFFRLPKSYVEFNRGLTYDGYSGLTERQFKPTAPFNRVLLLHATTQEDLETKYATLGLTPPGLDTWAWTLFEPGGDDYGGINDFGINNDGFTNSYDQLKAAWNTFYVRGNGIYYLGNFMPEIGYNTNTPDVSYTREGDYFLFIRIMEKYVGVYWVTSNQTVIINSFFVIPENEQLILSSNTTPMRRSMGYYSGVDFMRGQNATFNLTTSQPLNTQLANAPLKVGSGADISVTYSDFVNSTPVTINRNGAVVKISRTWE